MPIAAGAETATLWATRRAIDLWVAWRDDLGDKAGALQAAIDSIGRDGGRWTMVDDTGGRAPSPFDVMRAMEHSGVDDVRRVGVVAASGAGIDAGHRSGAAALVAFASDPEERRALVDAEPDVIVEPAEFARLDADRYGSRRAHRERVLLNPGPSVVSDRVHRSIGGPDLCHREPEYEALFGRVRRKLLDVAGVDDDWGVVLMGGSGTAAMEAMAIALVRPGRRLLVCRNGHYGERLERIAARHRVAVSLVDAAHTEPIDPGSVAAALDAHDDIDAVAVVVHETTTGLLNPVGEIAQIARARGVPVVADAISAFGSEPLDLAAGGIDLVAATSNKNLHGLPGVAIILASPVAQARIAEVPPRSLYFDLGLYLDAQRRGTVPFTPPIPATYALEAALDELLDEGVRERERAYRARMAYLDGELDRLGLVPVVAPDSRSGSVRSVPLPEGLSYPDLHDALKAEGYVIYAGLGSAAASSFRICALGTIRIPALQGFVAALERALATLPRTQVPTTGVAAR